MAEVEITQEEISGIDLSQVASMQLKDGTVVVVQGEGEFTQEELDQNDYGEDDYQDQSNQLRARPMMVVPSPKSMLHKPMGVPVVHPVGRPGLKPPVLVQPVHPRGPVRPGMPVPFRARPGMPGPRPGMPGPRPVVAPKPVVRPGMPLPGPVVRPAVPARPVPQVRPGMPVKPVGVPQRPLVSGQKPTVNQMSTAPGVPFRARPGEVEEDYDFQEEEYAEDEYYENDDQAEDAEYQLRARPLVVPVGATRPAPMGMKPRVVPVGPVPGRPPVPVVAPKPVMVPGPRRGPVGAPVVGHKVFRTRPNVRLPLVNSLGPWY